MTTFKIGDRVVSTSNTFGYFTSGETGEISDVDGDYVWVKPDIFRKYEKVRMPPRSLELIKLTEQTEKSIDLSVGQRKDDGKPATALLCPIALEGCSGVLAFGAKKYAAHNWQKGMPWSKVIGSLLRHIFKLMAGEDTDAESGLLHVDHILCNAMFLSNYARKHKAHDDRFKAADSK